MPGTPPLIGITTRSARGREESDSPLAAYVRAVSRAGGAPVLIPCDQEEPSLRAVFDRIDALVLPGGGDVDPAQYGERPEADLREVDPVRDRTETLLVRWAVEHHKPLLGICRGLQVLNVALGGSLVQELGSAYPEGLPHDQRDAPDSPGHWVHVLPKTRLAGLLGSGPLHTNSHHHQAVRRLAPDVVASARAADGVVEAVEIASHPYALAVQWHPERILETSAMLTLFHGLTEAARRE
jgi:putative glutamine amidotransferase